MWAENGVVRLVGWRPRASLFYFGAVAEGVMFLLLSPALVLSVYFSSRPAIHLLPSYPLPVESHSPGNNHSSFRSTSSSLPSTFVIPALALLPPLHVLPSRTASYSALDNSPNTASTALFALRAFAPMWPMTMSTETVSLAGCQES